MGTRTLTPAECETVITMSDDGDIAYVLTHQKGVITRLKNNPSAVLLDEGYYGDTAYAEFSLPKDNVNFKRR